MTTLAVRKPARPGLVLAGFTAYGALWGPYLSAMPEIQRSAGADAGQLGFALLAGALAALPAMMWVGRLVDRHGRPVVVAVVALFAMAAVTPMCVSSVPELVVAVALFGFGSGACNVVVVALASDAEAGAGRRVMSRAHALFSVGVLACSLATAAVQAAGVSPRTVAAALAVAVVGGAVAVRDRVPARLAAGPRPRRRRTIRPAALLCLLAGLAMVVESGVQQWSAVFLRDALGAPPAWASVAPGVFAAAMALGRLGTHWLSGRVTERTVLFLGGALAGVGILLLVATRLPLGGLAGAALVGAAISVSTPTTYGLAGRRAPADERGAVIGATASLANLGLLLGPALVGQVAQLAGLRAALTTLCLACVAVCLLAFRLPRPVC